MTSMNKARDEYVDYLLELLVPLGEVRAKRMFGGHGIFMGKLMFGLVVNEELYLKADDYSRPEYESRGLAAFTYTSKNRPVSLSYFHAPEEALEDGEMLCEWSRAAVDAALRARK